MTRLVGTLMVGLLVLSTACAPAAPSPAAPAQPTAAPAPAKPAAAQPPASQVKSSATSQFQQVLEAAKKEAATDKLLLWPLTPTQEPTHRQLFEAFEQRFGFKVQWEWIPIQAPEATTRMVTEAKAGARTADIVAGSVENVAPGVTAGFVDKYDWVGVFGEELPGIKEPADRVIDEYRGYIVAHWDVVYGIVWNTDALTREQVPTTIEDFADPKWSGKVAINTSGGAPFTIIGIEWGQEKTLSLVRKLVDNKAVLKRGSPAVVSAVVAGEASLGIGSVSQTCTQRKVGAPIQWRPMENIPVLPQHLYVPNTSKVPNLARLFVAWATTEGMPIIEERECSGRASDPKSLAYQTTQQYGSTIPIIEARTTEDMQKRDALEEEVKKIFTEA